MQAQIFFQESSKNSAERKKSSKLYYHHTTVKAMAKQKYVLQCGAMGDVQVTN